VSATGPHTYFGRTVELVQIAKPRLHMEEVTSKVVWWLLMMIVVLLALGAAVSLLKGGNIVDMVPLAVILLISAIPIALPTMFIISMALGSVQLARVGVLTTRLDSIENAATMDVLCADKTGTITQNRLYIADAAPMKGYTADDVILYGALASREANRDPIDIAFLSAAKDRNLGQNGYVRVEYTPFDPTTRSTSATIE
jgi:H+-transporting ATPase